MKGQDDRSDFFKKENKTKQQNRPCLQGTHKSHEKGKEETRSGNTPRKQCGYRAAAVGRCAGTCPHPGVLRGGCSGRVITVPACTCRRPRASVCLHPHPGKDPSNVVTQEELLGLTFVRCRLLFMSWVPFWGETEQTWPTLSLPLDAAIKGGPRVAHARTQQSRNGPTVGRARI